MGCNADTASPYLRCLARTPCQLCPWQHQRSDKHSFRFWIKFSPGAHHYARCPGDDKSHHVDDRHLQSLHCCPAGPYAQWLPKSKTHKTNLWGLDACERIGTGRVLRGTARWPFKTVVSLFLVSSPDTRSQTVLPVVQCPSWSPLLMIWLVSFLFWWNSILLVSFFW